MKFEIDQSGRIEETNRDTIMSIANKDSGFTIRIKKKLKQRIQKQYRNLGKPKMFPYYFSQLL